MAIAEYDPISISTDPRPIKGTWSGWKKVMAWRTKQSIDGKGIFGRINKRTRTAHGYTLPATPRQEIEYATDNELFKARLKGTA